MSRRKKKIVPDEVMEFGPLRVSRYENNVITETLCDQEEYDHWIDQLAEQYPTVCKEIDDVASEIAKIIVKHEPLPLLYTAHMYAAKEHMGLKTESEIGMDQIITQQWLIYLQNAIVSNPPNKNQATQIQKEEYVHLSELFAKMYKKIQLDYHLCDTAKQKKDGTFNEHVAEIDFLAQSSYNGIWGRQHPILIPEILHKLLSPHDAVIQKIFDINVQKFVDNIKKIQTSLIMGLGDASRDFDDAHKKSLAKVKERIESGEVNDESFENILNTVIRELDLQPQFQKALGQMRGYDLFDLQKVTDLPIKLLEALSLSPGEDQQFMDKSESYAGWTLKLYPSRLKPFIKVDGRYYCFELYNLTDNIYRALKEAILNADPSYEDDWSKKQGEIVEEYAFELFKKLLPNAEIYRNVKYNWYPNEKKVKKEECETDGIISFDDNLFIVEIRSGSFSPYSPTTDSKGYQNSIKNLIGKPYTQGRRLYEYLNEHKNGASLSDLDGNHLLDVRLSDYRRITICCVTLEQLTDFGGRLDKLKNIGTDIDVEKFPVWAVSVDDLCVYADLIQSPLAFCHYLEKRNDALIRLSNLDLSDELDHYGAYLKHNDYAEHFCGQAEFEKLQLFGYRDEIDTYYYKLLTGEQTSYPSQAITPLIKQIIEVADRQQKVGRCKMVSALLDLTREEQNELSDSIANVLSQQKTTGTKKFVNLSNPLKITATCEQDGVVIGTKFNSKEQALASMVNANNEHRHLIELKFTENCEIYDIDYAFLERADINASNQVRIKEIAKAQASKRLKTKRKIGRNEPCPCGSGEKYKKCHGR